MASNIYKNLLNKFLKKHKITLEELNKDRRYKKLKVEILDDIAFEAVKQERGVTETIRLTRSSGLTFKDSYVRDFYRATNDTIESRGAYKYGAKLRLDYRPAAQNIPFMRSREGKLFERDGFFYAFDVYLYCPDMKGKRLPKNVSKITGRKYYNITVEVAFWSNIILTKRQAYSAYFGDFSAIEDDESMLEIHGSDRMQIPSKYNECEEVGIKLDRVLKGGLE